MSDSQIEIVPLPYYDLTLSQRKFLALMWKVSGFFSIWGSCYILFDIFGSSKNRSEKLPLMYYRIMVAISAFDLFVRLISFLYCKSICYWKNSFLPGKHFYFNVVNCANSFGLTKFWHSLGKRRKHGNMRCAGYIDSIYGNRCHILHNNIVTLLLVVHIAIMERIKTKKNRAMSARIYSTILYYFKHSFVHQGSYKPWNIFLLDQ